MNTVDEHDDTSTIQIHLTKGWEIDSSDLTVNRDKILGNGSFGIVYLGQYHNMNVAVKSIAASSSQKEKTLAVTKLQAAQRGRKQKKKFLQEKQKVSRPPSPFKILSTRVKRSSNPNFLPKQEYTSKRPH